MVKARIMIGLAFVFILSVFLYLNCSKGIDPVSRLQRYAEDDFLKSWKVINPEPIEDDVIALHYANGAVVASLQMGRILYSDNAMMTIEYYSLSQGSDVLNDITDFNGYLAGVSSFGKLYRSSDGKSWTVVSGEAINTPLTAVASGNKLIGVGLNGVIISSDNLLSYSKVASNTQSDLYDIAVSDTDVYIAVGKDSTICRSVGGSTFECIRHSLGADLVGVAFGSGRFVAIAINNKVLVSEDYGVNWSVYDSGLSGTPTGIEFFNDEFIIYGFKGYLATSQTGDSFNRIEVNAPYNFYDVTYDGSLYYFGGGGGLMLTSSHPSTGFFKISPEIPGDLYALYKGIDYYVVAGAQGTVAISSDGLDFQSVSDTDIQQDLRAISSDKNQNGERFCAAATKGYVYTTLDITGSWTGLHLAGDNNLNDIVYALSKFILAGDKGSLYVSGDCINFIKVDTGSTLNFNRVIFDGTNIVVAGDGGALYRSNNPSGPYIKVNFPYKYNIVDVVYQAGTYLLLTQETIGANQYRSRIYSSTDLVNFSLLKSLDNTKLTRAAYGAGFFIFTTSFGNVYYTKDGQNFSMAMTGKYKEIFAALFMEKSFYLAGKDGILLRSGESSAGLEPQISVSADRIDFGDVVLNSSSSFEELIVSNKGKGDLIISSVGIAGSNPDQFSIESDGCSQVTLPEGGECSIYLDFKPTSTGQKSATLNIISNDKAHPTYSVMLSGRGVLPSQGAISTDKQSIDFGLVKIGTESSSQSITVSNVGTKGLEISDVYIDGNDYSDFVLKSEGCKGKTLAPNDKCSITLTFRPQSVGDKSAQLKIDSDDPNRPTAIVLLKGSGIDKDYPDISVDKNQIDFGIVKVGSESQVQSVLVSNRGSTGLAISDVRIEGPDASQFVIKSDICKGEIITPSSSCKIELLFRPTTQGNATAGLVISSNDPDTPNYTVNLYGTGRPGGGAAINVSPMSLDFGKVNTGSESAAQDVLIKSEGDSDLSVSLGLSGNDKDQFVIKSNNCPLKLTPGSSCKVSVSFKPTKSGLKSAELQIDSNDTLFPHVIVSLKGEGVVSRPSQISVSPTSYDFGKRVIGKVYPPVTFTVTNEGTGDLIIDSVSMKGDEGVFKIESDDCSKGQFATDGKCYIKVSFTPLEEQKYTGSLVISSNDSSTPKYEVPLSGEGIREEIKDAGSGMDIPYVGEDIQDVSISDVKSDNSSESGCSCSYVK